ncbi:MAG: 5-oxoprolinase subunit PxpA [Pyrinomonadaceae bacterium]
MKEIDLNCDMGEGFGAWKMGRDAELMDFVSSVNVACGFHAGDPSVIRRTVKTAIEKGVAVGAHPGYPDLQGFGRRAMAISPEEVYDMVLYQVAALQGICLSLGGRLHHVKPHGALYNQAAADEKLSEAIARAVLDLDEKLILYGLSGSQLTSRAESVGLRSASEVFADRTYQPDGSLTSRKQPDALISSTDLAVEQVIGMVRNQKVKTLPGPEINLKAETICIHGDGENALDFARTIKRKLEENGIRIRAIF